MAKTQDVIKFASHFVASFAIFCQCDSEGELTLIRCKLNVSIRFFPRNCRVKQKRTTYFGDIVVTSCSRRHVQSVSTWGDDHSQFPLVTGAATFETLRAPCFLQDVRYGSLLAKQHLQLFPLSFRILGHTPEELDPRRYTCSLFEKFQGQVVWPRIAIDIDFNKTHSVWEAPLVFRPLQMTKLKDTVSQKYPEVLNA